jgi:hypothetical protein
MPLRTNEQPPRVRTRWTTTEAVWLNSCWLDSSSPLAWWLVCGSLGRSWVYIIFWVGLVGRGPFNPCDIRVLLSDSPRFASLGLMMCHGHMGSCVAAPRQLRWWGMDHRRWVFTPFTLIFLESNNLQRTSELQCSYLKICVRNAFLFNSWEYWWLK